MKKTTTQIFCDDCNKEVKDNDVITFPKLNNLDNEQHICLNCIRDRIEHSICISPLGRRCMFCSGRGCYKEFYGYNNDFKWEDCNICKGKGYVKLILKKRGKLNEKK